MKSSRELIRAIISKEDVERSGFWMGNPTKETTEVYKKYFKTDSIAEIHKILGDDLVWLPGDSCYRGKNGNTEPFYNPRKTNSLSSDGVFADCEDVSEVDAYPWPDAADLDFNLIREEYKNAGDVYRAGGLWSPFYHLVGDMFGMETYFIKMYTNPDVVHAVTSHLVDYYLAGTEKMFKEFGEEIDGYFFGNDFGTQRDIMVSPECFDEFIFPYFKKLTNLGHEYNKQVILHSCGAITKVIPNLIDLGVDLLHPLQAKAEKMNAENLAQYNGKIAFFGGIDTQDLLVNGTAEEVRQDVQRVRNNLGPHIIVSPSHEALLPNVPAELIVAMSEEAHKNY